MRLKKTWTVKENLFSLILIISVIFVLTQNGKKYQYQCPSNEGQLEDLNDNLIIFNAIPKTASGTFGTMFKRMANETKEFQVIHWQASRTRIFNRDQREQRVKMLETSKKPAVFFEEMHFINMKDYGSDRNAIYFTNLREPFEWFKSRYQWFRSQNEQANNYSYYYLGGLEPVSTRNMTFQQWVGESLEDCIMTGREACNYKDGEIVDHPISYLCGGHDFCVKFGAEEALQKAKVNIEKFYPVVGIFEQQNDTLNTMRAKLPHWFIDQLPEELGDVVHKSRFVESTSAKAKAKLKSILKNEYEIYKFAVQRLQRQNWERINCT